MKINRDGSRDLRFLTYSLFYFKKLCLTFLLFAIFIFALSAKNKDDFVKVEIVHFPEKIYANSDFYIGLKVKLEKGYHVNSHTPLDNFLIPTTLTIEKNNNFKDIEYLYPAHKFIKVGFSDKPFPVYEGIIHVAAKVRLDSKYKKDNIVIKLKLNYQACDESNCYRPSEIKKTVKINITNKENQSILNSNVPEWLNELGIRTQPTNIKKDVQKVTQHKKYSLMLFLFFAFIGGLILNVMPCVLPVLSIKVISLIDQSGQDRNKIIKSNLLFTAGVFTTFLAIALLIIGLQHAGKQVGWGFQFQNTYFLIFILSVVFCFGLSLFGVFIINLPVPSRIVNSLDKYKGTFSSFFEGILATFLATPCTAPFLGTALGFAFSQSPVIIILIFIFIALGMSVPYIIISIFPHAAKFLPKPGAWMVSFKHFMGFPLMATVIWLLWILGKLTNFLAVIGTLSFLLSLTFGCWAIGNLITYSTSLAKKVSIWCLALLLIFITYNKLLKPVLNESHIIGRAEVLSSINANDEREWIPFSENKLNELKGKGRILFLEFTAEWCLTCQLNKQAVLNSEVIRNKFVKEKIIYMKADWTKNDPLITKTINSYGKAGVPLYVIYPAHPDKKPVILPEILTSRLLLKNLEIAK